MSDQKSKPSDKTLAQLQKSLLECALSGQPLPGSDRPFRFPDLAFVKNQPEVFLLDENLAESISVEDMPLPVRVMSRDELQAAAQAEGDRTYLSFQPPHRAGDAVRLGLEAKIATPNPSQRALGLSSVQVKFHKVGDDWQADDEPTMLAS
ncbi:MAG TPA: hypothetical protein VNA19_13990 [Pyrinomonadaceae bacterium]|nr:hypothetical protein [Pyrinomonadaceae bacterium]